MDKQLRPDEAEFIQDEAVRRERRWDGEERVSIGEDAGKGSSARVISGLLGLGVEKGGEAELKLWDNLARSLERVAMTNVEGFAWESNEWIGCVKEASFWYEGVKLCKCKLL